MNSVAISFQDVGESAWACALEAFCLKALSALKIDGWDLSVLLCGRETSKDLNSRFRGKDEPTDVLSFEMGALAEDGRYLPGDIVISLDGLRENAERFQVPEDEELRRLLIHGILHLNGMDHATNEGREPMLLLQEEILQSLEGSRILPHGNLPTGGGER